jgi:hypothetical protein
MPRPKTTLVFALNFGIDLLKVLDKVKGDRPRKRLYQTVQAPYGVHKMMQIQVVDNKVQIR